MLRQRAVGMSFVILAVLLLVPVAATAQSTGAIAGSVRDTTGAVLPGVTVEAASPALIEKVRTAVTDSQGEYKIVDLRPGVYAVTFTLVGFNTLKREGIELTVGVTANVSAELPVGALEETITVSGQSPLVDIQSATQHRTITRTQIEDLPTGRFWGNYLGLIPGVSVSSRGQDVGGSTADNSFGLSIHGSFADEMPRIFDGMRLGNIIGTGGGPNGPYPVNNGMIQEISVNTSGASAEYEVGGLLTNLIPKQGGNRFSTYVFANFSNDTLQSNNLDDALRARGATAPSVLAKIWEVNPAFGGPLRRDKLWFYGSYRYSQITEQPSGAYYAKDPAAYIFTPDLTRTPVNDKWTHSANLRLTGQTSSTSKLNLYGDNHWRCVPCANGLSATTAWEATTWLTTPVNRILQATWNWTVTNRLLIEVGDTYKPDSFVFLPQAGIPADRSGVVETRTGFTHRAQTGNRLKRRTDQWNGKAVVSYVTGSHQVRVGTQWYYGHQAETQDTSNDSWLNLLDGVPVSVTLRTTPLVHQENLKLNLGIYAQEQWTRKRLTLNLGARFDYLNAYLPEQHLPPVRYVGARDFAAVYNLPNWKNVSPRLGGAYDLFGSGRTALKWSLGRYVEGQGSGIAELVNPMGSLSSSAVSTGTRAWNDVNMNFIPDCDLTNQALNGECGPNNNANFGKPIVTTRYAPDVVTGWGTRGYNWETSTGLQQELRPGVAVEASYNRRWFGNFRVTDNTLVTPADYDPYCVTSPVDVRLPGGGQQTCGLYDIRPTLFGVNDNVITAASTFGTQTQIYDGVDFGVNVRLAKGVQVQGGTSTGRLKTNTCFVVDSPQALRFCNVRPPFLTQVKLVGIYPLPWWGLQTSATFQDLPGPEITASWAAPASAVTGLGRPLAGGARSVTVALVSPGTLFGDRLHEVDFRVAKNVKVGRARLQAQLDLYNLLNANPVLTQNNTYGSAWQRPLTILLGRMVKFGVQLDF